MKEGIDKVLPGTHCAMSPCLYCTETRMKETCVWNITVTTWVLWLCKICINLQCLVFKTKRLAVFHQRSLDPIRLVTLTALYRLALESCGYRPGWLWEHSGANIYFITTHTLLPCNLFYCLNSWTRYVPWQSQMSISFYKHLPNWVEPVDNKTEIRYDTLQRKYMVGYTRLSQRMEKVR